MDFQLGSFAPSGPLVAAFLTSLVLSILLGALRRGLSPAMGAG